ncbi:tRNA (N6-threonylcarbamoyladenosine(37)-N6)-methyltransferase TrmO [Nocardia sp. NPDC005998]|uniref:tRNA (N6-threonylcarbamoyladenosine(37)-N6)-methyltransferase TrmO n=1 Tax=Nocardia sp. NPDC005998 TaxID=3156894 RepID=UPI0033AA65E0
MGSFEQYQVRPIGWVRSPLSSRADAPRQGDEGAPPADIVLDSEVAAAAKDLGPGDEIIVLTWLHQADRAVLAVHPRGDRARPETGVFATRSPDRPNPIGLHRVTIADSDGHILTVHGLEAIDGTPVLDLKPVLGSAEER